VAICLSCRREIRDGRCGCTGPAPAELKVQLDALAVLGGFDRDTAILMRLHELAPDVATWFMSLPARKTRAEVSRLMAEYLERNR
jgi:hypothetical protein